MSAIRVLLVDDHSIVREGLRQVLVGTDGFDVVGEAGDGGQAISLAESLRPDVVLLDINLPGASGLDVAKELRRRVPESRILILSVHDDREFVLEAVRVGAHGYLRKDTTPADLRAAITAVHGGDAFFSPPVARRLTEALRGASSAATSADPASVATLESLTNREREDLMGVARGRLNKQIAAELGISVRTVEAHRDSMMRKLQLRSPAALTRFAMEVGLLDRSGNAS